MAGWQMAVKNIWLEYGEIGQGPWGYDNHSRTGENMLGSMQSYSCVATYDT